MTALCSMRNLRKKRERERERPQGCTCANAVGFCVCVAATSLPAQTPCFQRKNHNASKANYFQNEPTPKAQRPRSSGFSHDKGQHPRRPKTCKLTVNAEHVSLRQTAELCILHCWMQTASEFHCRDWCGCTGSAGQTGRRWHAGLGCSEHLWSVGSLIAGLPDPNQSQSCGKMRCR